jgi:hypothetical protein
MKPLNLYVDGIPLDLKQDTIITLSRQVNDIAELKDRQADYSNQFSLPRTATNSQLLTNKHARLKARLEQYGASTDGWLVVNTEDKEYKCVFYSGATNFFTLIEGKKLSDLYMVALEHIFNKVNIVGSRAFDWTSGYIYPFINSTKDTTGYSENSRDINAATMIPCVFGRWLMEKIASEVGWKIEGDVLNTQPIIDSIIPLAYNNGSTDRLRVTQRATNNDIFSEFFAPFAQESCIAAIGFPFASGFVGMPSGVTTGASTTEFIVPFDTTDLDDAFQVQTMSYPMGNYWKLTGAGGGTTIGTFKCPVAKADFIADIAVSISTAQGNVIFERMGNVSGIPIAEIKLQFPIQYMSKVKLVAYGSNPTSPNNSYRTLAEWRYGVHYFSHGAKNFNKADVTIYKDERVCLVIERSSSAQQKDFSGFYSSWLNNQWTFNPSNLNQAFPPSQYQSFYGFILKQQTKIQIQNTRGIPDGQGYAVPYNGYWGISQNMPDMSQKDFMKAMAQRFCLIYDADSNSQTLKVYSFKDIYDNIPYAYDWSDKVDAGTPNIRWHSNYAQRNDMLFTEDTDVPKGYGNAYFNIDDTSLQARKTALTCQFAATPLITRLNGDRIPNMPVWGDTYLANEFWKTKYKARILNIYRKPNGSGVNINDGTTTTISTDLPYAYFDNTTGNGTGRELNMQDAINNDYAELIRALNNYEMIEDFFWLTPQDFLGFDSYRPVYVRKHQGYFYVNKIDGFVEGKMTKVQMLRLI